MAQSVDDLSFDYEEDGVLVRKQLDKTILNKGSWATVMFRYQEYDPRSGDYREPKVAIVRYKKAGGIYRRQSGFNITNIDQARQIISTLNAWFTEEGAAPTGDDPPVPNP